MDEALEEQLNYLLHLFASADIPCPLVRLYNLTADPNEQHNLAKEMPGKY